MPPQLPAERELIYFLFICFLSWDKFVFSPKWGVRVCVCACV